MGRLIPELFTDSFCFDLPKRFVAQHPAENHDESRLLVLRRGNPPEFSHSVFKDITGYFMPGDCLVLNKTMVFPARLDCTKATGGKAEILALEQLSPTTWKVLVRSRVLNRRLILPDGKTSAIIREKTPDGEYILEIPGNGFDLNAVINEYGRVPLPPYIRKGREEKGDRFRYQTVYAQASGSVAAPTAGLHFTADTLKKIKDRGVAVAEIVLHIGWGTFKPITSKILSGHRMLPEYFEVDAREAEKINSSRRNGKKVVAVGTSSVRTLETLSDDKGVLKAGSGKTDLFIYPGYSFKCVDGMVTNFHLPGSTPLMLVCALAGKDSILSAYREAMEKNYRFYSYGDAMLIL